MYDIEQYVRQPGYPRVISPRAGADISETYRIQWIEGYSDFRDNCEAVQSTDDAELQSHAQQDRAEVNRDTVTCR